MLTTFAFKFFLSYLSKMTEINAIIQKLFESSLARNFLPSFSFYLKELNSLLDLKVALDLKQRITCINILYPLLNVEVGIDSFLIQGISNSLTRLLK